ncbi:MAG: ATP-binding protein [Pirellulales bacterium]|nr:ATP-binding protein [Pirellulales bacterium]
MPFLHIIHGPNQGSRCELDETPLTIGRDASNHLHLGDPQISRFHARIKPVDGIYLLEDRASSNGTYINGLRVAEHELSAGDQIQLGDTVLEFSDTSLATGRQSARDRIQIVPKADAEESRIVQTIRPGDFGGTASNVEAEVTPSDWLARAQRHLQVMYRTALAVSHTLDIDQLLKRIMQLIFDWVDVDRGCIMLLSQESGSLEPAAFEARDKRIAQDEIRISRTILDFVVEHNEGVLTTNAQEDQRFKPAVSIMQQGIREAICVPMQGRYDMLGVIYIDSTTPAQDVLLQRPAQTKLTEEHLKLMVAIAHQAALAVEDTRYYSAMVSTERLAAVGQTIAMMAHHIKNILQGLEGGGFLIREGLEQHDEAMVRRGWEFVEKNQARITKVISDMLTYSKQREPDLQPADLNQTVFDVVDLMRARASEHGARIDFQADESLPVGEFDAEALHGAILNVITNAIDACADQNAGRILVATKYQPESRLADIVIEDNGAGIPETEIENIFTLFVSEKRSRGTGLGLPVTKKVLTEHGGDVTVESVPGQGTRFTLTLPLRACGEENADAPASPTLDGERIEGA